MLPFSNSIAQTFIAAVVFYLYLRGFLRLTYILTFEERALSYLCDKAKEIQLLKLIVYRSPAWTLY